MINARGRKEDFEQKELEKKRKKEDKKELKRKAEEDGDQDDRFFNQGASSSSVPAPTRVPI